MRTYIAVEGRALESYDAMVRRWQELPYLFQDACWTMPKDGKLSLLFTSFCLN